MKIEPYLFFNGRSDEAIAFYETALGAELVVRMRFSDAPEPLPDGAIPAGWGDKVMHACLRIGETQVMLSDGCGTGGPDAFAGFSLTLNVRDAAEAERLFRTLSEGGVVVQPFGPTFFSPGFGMVTDRFGAPWTIVADAAQAAAAA